MNGLLAILPAGTCIFKTKPVLNDGPSTKSNARELASGTSFADQFRQSTAPTRASFTLYRNSSGSVLLSVSRPTMRIRPRWILVAWPGGIST